MPHCGDGRPKSENPLAQDHVVYPTNPGTEWQGEAVSDGLKWSVLPLILLTWTDWSLTVLIQYGIN